jgi:cold-inducible RNA-binding protein
MENRMNIYVGNLSYKTTDTDLRDAFSAHGEVTSVAIITDRDSGQSKGFGFVEMADDAAARAAIKALDGAEVQGRQLKVNEARPKTDRPSGGGGNRGGGGYGGGGGGGRGGSGGGGRRDRW